MLQNAQYQSLKSAVYLFWNRRLSCFFVISSGFGGGGSCSWLSLLHEKKVSTSNLILHLNWIDSEIFSSIYIFGIPLGNSIWSQLTPLPLFSAESPKSTVASRCSIEVWQISCDSGWLWYNNASPYVCILFVKRWLMENTFFSFI